MMNLKILPNDEDKVMQIETPYYIFDKAKFISLVKDYQQNADIYYPLKANDDDKIIDTLIELSSCFETDSLKHIKMIINKGISPEQILYSYPLRDLNDVECAVKLGIKKFVVDSTDEYIKITKFITNGLFFIRLNVIEILGLKFSSEQNKWGLSVYEAKKLIDTISRDNGKVIGLSFYVFKEISERTTDTLTRLLATIRDNFEDYKFDFLNVGGGISSVELSELKNIVKSTQKIIGAKKIIIEPGRPLLDPCIDMVVSVIAIKKMNNTKMIFINSGIYNGLIDIIIKRRNYVVEHFDRSADECEEETLICGSSSDISDFLGSFQISKNIKVGDKLIIKETGAYSSVMQTNFCGKDRIKMILKDDTQ